MRKLILSTLFLMLSAGILFGQEGYLNDIAQHDRLTYDPADTTRPWTNDNGVRSVHVTNDLDGDGKAEVIGTDYTNGGRVHVMEYNEGVLEVVWSSPIQYEGNPNSVPRWVQSGDMDGDGVGEIIFPVGPRYEGEIQVWENVGDNDYGTEPAITMQMDAFTVSGVGEFRTDRERATVYDFDSDGQSELITCNGDQAVYILSVSGGIPGPFSSFELEGGDPAVVDTNTFSGGSWWHSVPGDINGDGQMEIVNHYWNYYGFWSITVNGEDDYTYPTGNPDGGVAGPQYYEYFRDEDADLVSYRGVAPADLDGDGKHEIVGQTGYVTEFAHGVAVLSLDEGDEGISVWNEDAFSYLASADDVDFGGNAIDHWSIYAADLNGNGKDEILLGGSYNENVVSFEYKGSGDIGELANYDMENWFPGPQKSLNQQSTYITVRDSAGVVDTVYPDAAWTSPVVMSLSHGDVTGDGNDELAIGYQSNGYDSVTVYHQEWSEEDTAYVGTDTTMIQMDPQVNIRVLSSTATGLKELTNKVVTPDDYKLEPNYPNPFNPTTTIRFSLPVNKQISLVVYDVLGREVKTLINSKQMRKGSYEVTWDGTNNAGNEVSSGTYIYRLEYGNFSQSRKMMFMKQAPKNLTKSRVEKRGFFYFKHIIQRIFC